VLTAIISDDEGVTGLAVETIKRGTGTYVRLQISEGDTRVVPINRLYFRMGDGAKVFPELDEDPAWEDSEDPEELD
jgi:hypothetical protein